MEIEKESVEGLCHKLKPVLGKRADSLWKLYMAEADPARRRATESLMNLLASKHLKPGSDNVNVLLPPPTENNHSGEIEIGGIDYLGKSFGSFALSREDLTQHVLCVGRSGAGKTNLIFNVIKQLSEKRIPFWTFDWKRSYRNLKTVIQNLTVMTVGRDVAPFRWNPLVPPPGFPCSAYDQKIAEIISHGFFLGDGCIWLLMKGLQEIRQTIRDRPVKVMDLFQWFIRYRATGREALWHASCIRALGALCFGENDMMVNSDQPENIRTLLTQNVVFEMEGASESIKIFLTEALLFWVNAYRLGSPKRGELRHVNVIEEAHHLALKTYEQSKAGETLLEQLIREARETGESYILVDQDPYLLSLPVRGNTKTTIAFNLKTNEDIRATADAMGMTLDESRYMGLLDTGQAIVRVQGRHAKPFLVRVPLVRMPEKTVSDWELKGRTIGSDSGKPPSRARESADSKPIPPISDSVKWTEDEKDFLRDVVEHPVSPVTERYERMGLSTRQGDTMKENLVVRGFLKPLDVSTCSGRVVLLQLTEDGIPAARSLGCPVNTVPRWGGLIHQFWLARAEKKFRAEGYDVEREAPIGGGKTVDLVISKNGERVAVEIETGNSDAAGNINKCLDAAFPKVICLHTNKAAVQKLAGIDPRAEAWHVSWL